MSVVSVGEKREREERERDDVVIISNMGDIRPSEMLPDDMTALCLQSGASVSSYVCVPYFGFEPIFLANFVGSRGKRYVKKMINGTAYLNNLASDVVILFCHGRARGVQTENDKEIRVPSFLCFNEPHSVDIRGNHRDGPPHASIVWACSEFRDGPHTFSKPEVGVTLSQVVRGSKLVMLLCCFGRNVITEYSSESSDDRPDFVVFVKESVIWNISVQVFITLLMTTISGYFASGQPGNWDELVKKSVCQVLLWVQDHGSDRETNEGLLKGEHIFWEFLLSQRYITTVQGRTETYQIKGCSVSYSINRAQKFEILDDLRAVNLMLWDGGSRTTTRSRSDRGYGCYDLIDYNSGREKLEAWIQGTTALPNSRQGLKPHQGLELLLLQLQGLLRADCSI